MLASPASRSCQLSANPPILGCCNDCICTCRITVLKKCLIVLLQKKSKSGLAEEADRLQHHVAETKVQLELVKEQLESLQTSTGSTIQSLGRNDIVSVLPSSSSQKLKFSLCFCARRTLALCIVALSGLSLTSLH